MKRIYEAAQSRGKRVWSAVVVGVVTTALFLYVWTYEAVQEAHTMPVVEWYDIYGWVRMGRLSPKQLSVVAQQTGLHEEVVERLVQEGKWQCLLELQGAYFAKIQTEGVQGTIVTITEHAVDEQGKGVKVTFLPDIQEGDILITKNSRFLGWRNGHAGLVVDAERGLVLEAIMLGTDTKLCSIEKWRGYPAFQVLRLRTDVGVSVEQVVTYALENMQGVPYRLLAGVKERLLDVMSGGNAKAKELSVPDGTQCAHLVWHAYMQAGVDLDSDGGFVVTPVDIQNSPYLEVIQSYGY